MAALALTAGILAGCASPGTVTAPPPPPQAPVVAAPPPVVVAPPPPVASAAPMPQDDKVRVALLLPLSGASAAIGQSMLDAAQMALFDLGDDKFVLMPRDSKGEPAAAAAAAKGAIDEGASLILGPLFAPQASAVKPVLAQAGRPVPVVSFSSDWNVAGGGLWVLGFQPQEQVRRVVNMAAGRGALRFGLLAPSTPYGDATLKALTEAAAAVGGQVTRVERYTPGTPDMTSVVRRLSNYDGRKAGLAAERSRLHGAGDAESQTALRRLSNADTFGEMPFDAVLIAEGGTKLREIASLFPFFDIDPAPGRLLGTGLWDEGGLGREPALIGGWYAAPPSEGRQAFEQRFQQLYGYKPHRLATLAYDATALAAVLAKAGGRDGFDPAALTNPNGFAGVEGIFRLVPSGVSERGLAVMEVTRTGSSLVDPAPTSFQPTPSS
ncbi:ABC transporter substrate-binding protein [Niveispirillum sp. SYP-B3756]|nr:ABC transporter substrate-binding protein [Niveispirillum sp. SYP-B3756]